MKKSIEVHITEAIRHHDMDALRQLFREYPEQLNAHTFFAGQTWIAYAAFEGDLESVKLLLELGADPNKGNKHDNINALTSAAQGSSVEIVRLLLEAGTVMDTSASVRNPLFAAASNGPVEVARLLLDHGIDSTVRYSGGSMTDRDAIAHALMWGQTEVAQLIAERQADGDPEKLAQILKAADIVADREAGVT